MEEKEETKGLTLIDTLEMLPSLDVSTISSPAFQDQYNLLTDYINKFVSVKKIIDTEIKRVMEEEYLKTGDSTLVSGDRKYTYIPSSTRVLLDTKKLQEEQPEIYSKYAKVSQVSSILKSTKIPKKTDEMEEDF